MNPLQPEAQVGARGVIRSAGVWLGKVIAPFTGKNQFSLSKINELRAAVNCFLNLTTSGGIKATMADTGWHLDGSGSGNGAGGMPGSGSGMNYRGTYSNANAYVVGDVVRVKDGGAATLGVWICVVPVAAGGTLPLWPEPHDVNPANSNTWELIAMSPKLLSGCAGGTSHSYYLGLIEV